MPRPVTCPESPALATKKQQLEQLDDAQDEVCGCAWVHSHDYANNSHWWLFILILPPLSLPPCTHMPMKKEQVSHVIHANAMPQFDKVFQPQLPNNAIDTQPFNFEEW